MKIRSLNIEGFAGVAGRLDLDLDSSVVVLVGQNGFGKTTICDALAWGLTGLHPRGADPRSLYSTSGETQVTVTGDSAAGEWVVTRRIQNPGEKYPEKLQVSTQLTFEGQRHLDGDADRWLARNLVPLSDYADLRNTMTTLTQSLYMQQESLREYLTSRSDDERFTALSRMVGAGSLSDFLGAFETSLRAWKRAVTRLESDLEAPRARVEQMKQESSQLELALRSSDRADLQSEWAEWWAAAQEHLPEADAPAPELTFEQLQRTRSILAVRADALAAEVDSLAALESELGAPLPPAPSDAEMQHLHALLERRKVDLHRLEEQLSLARAAVVSGESALQRLSGERRELAAIAELAQRHLSSLCPVCGQAIEEESVLRRLASVIDRRDEAVSTPEYVAALNLYNEVADAVGQARSDLDSAAALVTTAQQKTALRARLRDHLLERVAAVGVLGTPQFDQISDVVVERRRALEAERFNLGRLTEHAARIDAVSRLETMRTRLLVLLDDLTVAAEELAAQEDDLRSRQQTATEAETIGSLLRSDAEQFVNSRLDDIQPILDQLYAAVDPHPTFRSVRLATRIHYGKHRLNPIVEDAEADVSVSDPGRTLSTSQANALAVTLFLAFNIGLTPTLLRSIVLDDPLQNLDEVHLLGLVDLLRKLQPLQMIVTTHDSAFAALLMRKLRPRGTDEGARLIRITKWDRGGPLVEVSDILADSNPLKIALVG